MPRVKGGPKSRQRRKKRLKLAKGQYGAKSRLFRTATESVDKGQAYAYVGRKHRKRDFRQLWIARISAGLPPSPNGILRPKRSTDTRLASPTSNRPQNAASAAVTGIAMQPPGRTRAL